MAFFTLSGAATPEVTTDVRRIETDPARPWQVTVSARGVPAILTTPPRFEVNWIEAPQRARRRRRGRLDRFGFMGAGTYDSS